MSPFTVLISTQPIPQWHFRTSQHTHVPRCPCIDKVTSLKNWQFWAASAISDKSFCCQYFPNSIRRYADSRQSLKICIHCIKSYGVQWQCQICRCRWNYEGPTDCKSVCCAAKRRGRGNIGRTRRAHFGPSRVGWKLEVWARFTWNYSLGHRGQGGFSGE